MVCPGGQFGSVLAVVKPVEEHPAAANIPNNIIIATTRIVDLL